MRKENEEKDGAVDDDDDEATSHGTPPLKADCESAYNTFASFVPWLWFFFVPSFLSGKTTKRAVDGSGGTARHVLADFGAKEKKMKEKNTKKTSRESGRHQNKANHIESERGRGRK